jgi:hypothetical protein
MPKLPTKLLLSIAASFLILLAGLFAFRSVFSGSDTTIRSSTVAQELREVSRLETAVFSAQQIIDVRRNDDGVIQQLLFGDKLLLIAQGQVTAGVDLSEIEEDDISISEDGQRAELRLPPVQLFDVSLDEEETRVYDRTTGLLTEGDQDLEGTAREEAVAQIEAAALEGGVLEQAARNAERQVEALVRALGFAEVVVRVGE